ncbi:unnamed protein product, partial [Didymodactylos carnosus]
IQEDLAVEESQGIQQSHIRCSVVNLNYHEIRGIQEDQAIQDIQGIQGIQQSHLRH